MSALLASDVLTVAKMTSREIAELVERRHDNVMRTIKALAESGVIRTPQIEDLEEISNLGLPIKREVYVFEGQQGKRDSIVVVAQLSPEFTARLVDRWQELEGQIRQPQVEADPLSRALSLSALAVKAAEAFGFTGNQALLSANRVLLKHIGVNLLEDMGHGALLAPEQVTLLTPSDIALRLGISKTAVNPLLVEKGLQTAIRDHKNRLVYEPTEAGLEFAALLDTGKSHGNGTPVRQLKWKSSILKKLGS